VKFYIEIDFTYMRRFRMKDYRLRFTNMVTVRNCEVIFKKFNMMGISNNGH
jgi:hypothetical protein